MSPCEELFELYLRDVGVAAGASTTASYRQWMKPFFKHVGNLSPSVISLRDVSDFIVAHSKVVSGQTVMYVRGQILRFWQWLEDHGHITKNHLALRKLPKVFRGSPNKKAFTFEQYQHILVEAEKYKHKFISYHWKECCMVGWHTGLRVSDVFNLKWECIDLEGEIITIIAKKTRRFNQVLIIPIEPELLEMFKRLRQSPPEAWQLNDPHCFPHMADGVYPSGSRTYYFNRIMAGAGIPEGYSFHSFRHSFDSRLLNTGSNPLVISALTGQSLQTIQNYAHISMHAKKSALQAARSEENSDKTNAEVSHSARQKETNAK